MFQAPHDLSQHQVLCMYRHAAAGVGKVHGAHTMCASKLCTISTPDSTRTSHTVPICCCCTPSNLSGDDKPSHPAADAGNSTSWDTPAAAQPPSNIAGLSGDSSLRSGAVGSGHAAVPQAGIGAVLKQGWDDLEHGGVEAPHAVSTGVSGSLGCFGVKAGSVGHAGACHWIGWKATRC